MPERLNGPTPQEVIRRHVEGADDWEWQEIAKELYVWTDRISDWFFDRQMPNALLSFESMDYRVLAAYTMRRNAQGLLYEITFNVKHLTRPLWETLETLMHEYLHLWQQNFGKNPVKRNYHNQEFVSACEAIGLHPAIGSGVHLRPADGLFAQFLRVYGVEEPAPMSEPKTTPKGRPMDWWADPESRPRGRSSLKKWSCGCQIVRVGTKEFHAQCLRCHNLFERVEPEAPAEPAKRAVEEADSEPAPPDTDEHWEQAQIVWAVLRSELPEEDANQAPASTP